MRLIDADNLMDRVGSIMMPYNAAMAAYEIKTTIDQAPTIDAVPVVRCEDCKYCYLWEDDGVNKRGKCAFFNGDNQYVRSHGYCYLGER